jgi:hypothetical protein
MGASDKTRACGAMAQHSHWLAQAGLHAWLPAVDESLRLALHVAAPWFCDTYSLLKGVRCAGQSMFGVSSSLFVLLAYFHSLCELTVVVPSIWKNVTTQLLHQAPSSATPA